MNETTNTETTLTQEEQTALNETTTLQTELETAITPVIEGLCGPRATWTPELETSMTEYVIDFTNLIRLSKSEKAA